jgi:hypothetical protein
MRLKNSHVVMAINTIYRRVVLSAAFALVIMLGLPNNSVKLKVKRTQQYFI